MIAHLFEKTLELQKKRFERLIVEVVRAGLTYRKKNGSPVTADEIERINAQILALGFKFPDLWDKDFQAALRDDTGVRAQERVNEARTVEKLRESERSGRSVKLESLKQEFLTLHGFTDRQKAGLRLEMVLNGLFAAHNLSPREPFRVTGEQIDGSFELDHEIYLLEAKWHKEPLSEGHLYIFREKIEGKSKFTRGVFLSINGVTADALAAITQGKQPTFFVMDGYDLLMALDDKVPLDHFLRRRQRLLAEEGCVWRPFQQCGL